MPTPDLPEWTPPQTRTLTVVSPHPDDETLGAGGLIYTCSELGYEITIVLVTDGEHARPDDPDLGTRRIGELRSALMRLAPDGAHVARLGLPDGDVASHEAELVRRLLLTVPRDCTLVAPYEKDGRTDYAATSRACYEAARQLGIPCVRYPISGWGPKDLGGCSIGRLTLSDTARRAKQQAIGCYRSQIEAGAVKTVVPPHEVFLL